MRLSTSQHSFLLLVAQAAFANPFGKERDDPVRQIVGNGPNADSEPILKKTLLAVDKFLVEANLLRETGNIRFFNIEEQKLLNTAMLFRLFHRYQLQFDQHIHAQEAHPDSILTLSFATALTSELTGFLPSQDQVERYIGIFFQLRRAWYYIDKKITGASPSVRLLRRQLWDNVFTANLHWYDTYLCMQMESFSTLLLGETGTGKGTVAAVLGKSHFIPWDSQKQKFAENFVHSIVALNLAGLPETLVESELFGHRKGAFTGAVDQHIGVFGRICRLGAVFIDEIGGTSVATQVKLLRVLQERTFSPVGSRDKETFCGRIIAATNRDLSPLMTDGTFREDFYYRLASDTISLPNLYQRFCEDPGELSLLARHLLMTIFNIASEELTAQVETILKRDIPTNYTWPGNMREFEQRLRRILLTGACVPERQYRDSASGPKNIRAHSLQSAQEVMQTYCRGLYDKLGSYELVARTAGLDRRTVKKYIVD